MTTDPVRQLTQDEWLAEAKTLFGDDPDAWAFECRSCGTVSTVADFKALGVDGQRAPFECIGRVHSEQGAVHSEQGATQKIDGNTVPCNWHTCGMFRISGLTEVVYRDSAKTTLVFPFANRGAPESEATS